MSDQNTFEIEMSKHEPYRIRALNADIDFTACKPALDSFNVYDDDKEDDVQIFPQEGSQITYHVVKEEDDVYAIIMSGTVILTDEDKKLVLAKEGAVDYALDLSTADDDSIESDEDYELVENYKILLTEVS
jgi:hypothetical protein